MTQQNVTFWGVGTQSVAYGPQIRTWAR